MPSNKILTATYLTVAERAVIEKRATDRGVSIANWLRLTLGLKPLKLGAPAKAKRLKPRGDDE